MDKNTIINSHVNSHIDSLSVIHTNADNLINKLTELKLVISSMQIKPQVIAITEIKPKCLQILCVRANLILMVIIYILRI